MPIIGWYVVRVGWDGLYVQGSVFSFFTINLSLILVITFNLKNGF